MAEEWRPTDRELFTLTRAQIQEHAHINRRQVGRWREAARRRLGVPSDHDPIFNDRGEVVGSQPTRLEQRPGEVSTPIPVQATGAFPPPPPPKSGGHDRDHAVYESDSAIRESRPAPPATDSRVVSPPPVPFTRDTSTPVMSPAHPPAKPGTRLGDRPVGRPRHIPLPDGGMALGDLLSRLVGFVRSARSLRRPDPLGQWVRVRSERLLRGIGWFAVVVIGGLLVQAWVRWRSASDRKWLVLFGILALLACYFFVFREVYGS